MTAGMSTVLSSWYDWHFWGTALSALGWSKRDQVCGQSQWIFLPFIPVTVLAGRNAKEKKAGGDGCYPKSAQCHSASWELPLLQHCVILLTSSWGLELYQNLVLWWEPFYWLKGWQLAEIPVIKWIIAHRRGKPIVFLWFFVQLLNYVFLMILHKRTCDACNLSI